MSSKKKTFTAGVASSGKTFARTEIATAGVTVTSPLDPNPLEPVILVEVEQMHPSDVMTLKRRVEAANTRITAECTELRAAQYGPFQPEVVLAQYEALERQVTAAKRLLMKSA